MTRDRSVARRIHTWTALKLEYLDHYLQAYVTATKKTIYETYYVDAFAGPGDCILVETGQTVQGSPWRALSAVPRFGSYWFIDSDSRAASHLKTRISAAGVSDANVCSGDCNAVLPSVVLPQLSRQAPGFAFLDPTGLQLHWTTVGALAAHRSQSSRKMELLILFPFDMAINQNLSNPAAQEALDQFFGIADWRKELRTSQLRNEEITQRRQRFTHVYVQNLRSLGYQYVEEYGPLHWRNRPLYSVIFATDHPVGAKIMRDVWSKPRSIPGQLDYAPVRRPNLP